MKTANQANRTWFSRLKLLIFPFLSPKEFAMENSGELPKAPELPDCSSSEKVDRYKLDFELWMLKVENCKLRAEEYRVRYEGLRTLEWNTILQIYTGYAAIALVFNYLTDGPGRFQDSLLFAWVAIFVTCGFYIASRYLSYRIQERLVRFGETLENYMKHLDTVLHTPSPNPGTAALGHQYYWTYDTQFILNTTTFVSLLAFEVARGRATNSPTRAGSVFAVLLFISVIVSLRWIRLPKIVEKGSKEYDKNQERAGGTLAEHSE